MTPGNLPTTVRPLMGFFDKVSRLVGSATAASHDAVAALAASYNAAAGRARQLHRHADIAPQSYSANGLRELAALEEEQVLRLKGALQAAGAQVPSIRPTDDVPAPNHWARLVHDLEAHQLSTNQFRQFAMKFAEQLPQTAELFSVLCHEEQQHCERLRALIARADPQALD